VKLWARVRCLVFFDSQCIKDDDNSGHRRSSRTHENSEVVIFRYTQPAQGDWPLAERTLLLIVKKVIPSAPK